jgi:hypothetical protein
MSEDLIQMYNILMNTYFNGVMWECLCKTFFSFFNRTVFHPVGIYWGIKTKKVYKIADIPELEKAYKRSKTLPHDTIKVSIHEYIIHLY